LGTKSPKLNTVLEFPREVKPILSGGVKVGICWTEDGSAVCNKNVVYILIVLAAAHYACCRIETCVSASCLWDHVARHRHLVGALFGKLWLACAENTIHVSCMPRLFT